MRFRMKVTIVFLSTIVAFYAIIGGYLSRPGEAEARGSQYAQLEIFEEVLNHIIHDYVDQPDLEKVRIGSLRGLAEGLDPYCAYLTPEQVKQFNANDNRGETGLLLSKVSGYAYVVAVLKGSPAEQTGIHDGDFIEYIGKVPTRDMSLYDAQQLLTGPAGSQVEIRIVRQGQPRKLSIQRVRLTQPPIIGRVEETGIGYIRITSLVDGKAAEVKSQVSDLTAKGAQKIILDLRGSANGKLQEGIAVANLFIDSGVLARVLGKEGKEIQLFRADSSKAVFPGSAAVIIDRSTAGPAETIASAFRDLKRGEVIGERSFGAGSEQQLYPLSDGGALLITTAKYAPANGKPFMEESIYPTVKVDRPAEAEPIIPAGDEDEEQPEEKPEQPPTAQPKTVTPPQPPAEDLQLKKALEILRQAPGKAAAASQKSAAVRIPHRVPQSNSEIEIRQAA